MTTEALQKKWYEDYYRRTGAGRNDLRCNREVLLQAIASEISVIQALSGTDVQPESASVADIGCGNGGGLPNFLKLGFRPSGFVGIDIQADRLAIARELYPHVQFVHGDASRMEFPSARFDLVTECTLFATLGDEVLRRKIASEMLRICKPGGWLLLIDWRTPAFLKENYRPLSLRDVRELFHVGDSTELVGIKRGALVPPLGRFLSSHLPALYFPIAALCPFLVGQVVYLLRKK